MANLNNIVLISKRIKQWYTDQGFIKTVFGWMHKDWISEAFKQGWISGSDPMTYNLVIHYKQENKVSRQGRGKWTEEIEIPNMNMVASKKEGRMTMRFFKWLEDKNDVFNEIHKDDFKKMADYTRETVGNRIID